jgi:hypothetical protein
VLRAPQSALADREYGLPRVVAEAASVCVLRVEYDVDALLLVGLYLPGLHADVPRRGHEHDAQSERREHHPHAYGREEEYDREQWEVCERLSGVRFEQYEPDGEREYAAAPASPCGKRGGAAVASEVAREHEHRRNLHELGGLELTQTGYTYPAALAVNLQADAGYEHDDEEQEAEGVEGGRDVHQLPVVGEGDREHHDGGDAEAYQLLLPVRPVGLRVVDHPRPEQGYRQRQQRQQPVEVAEFSLFQNRYQNSSSKFKVGCKFKAEGTLSLNFELGTCNL